MNLYRIALSGEPVRNANFDGVPSHYIARLKAWGVLVPVEPCEHGNYDRHIIGFENEHDVFGHVVEIWCPGAGIGDNGSRHELGDDVQGAAWGGNL